MTTSKTLEVRRTFAPRTTRRLVLTLTVLGLAAWLAAPESGLAGPPRRRARPPFAFQGRPVPPPVLPPGAPAPWVVTPTPNGPPLLYAPYAVQPTRPGIDDKFVHPAPAGIDDKFVHAAPAHIDDGIYAPVRR